MVTDGPSHRLATRVRPLHCSLANRVVCSYFYSLAAATVGPACCECNEVGVAARRDVCTPQSAPCASRHGSDRFLAHPPVRHRDFAVFPVVSVSLILYRCYCRRTRSFPRRGGPAEHQLVPARRRRFPRVSRRAAARAFFPRRRRKRPGVSGAHTSATSVDPPVGERLP